MFCIKTYVVKRTRKKHWRWPRRIWRESQTQSKRRLSQADQQHGEWGNLDAVYDMYYIYIFCVFGISFVNHIVISIFAYHMNIMECDCLGRFMDILLNCDNS